MTQRRDPAAAPRRRCRRLSDSVCADGVVRAGVDGSSPCGDLTRSVGVGPLALRRAGRLIRRGDRSVGAVALSRRDGHSFARGSRGPPVDCTRDTRTSRRDGSTEDRTCASCLRTSRPTSASRRAWTRAGRPAHCKDRCNGESPPADSRAIEKDPREAGRHRAAPRRQRPHQRPIFA